MQPVPACSLCPPAVLPTPPPPAQAPAAAPPQSSRSCLVPPLPSPPKLGLCYFRGAGAGGTARASIPGHGPLSRPGAHPQPHFPSHPCIPTTDLGLSSPLTVRAASQSAGYAHQRGSCQETTLSPTPLRHRTGELGARRGGEVLRPSLTFPLMSALLGSRHLKGEARHCPRTPSILVGSPLWMVAPSPSGALHPSCTGL